MYFHLVFNVQKINERNKTFRVLNMIMKNREIKDFLPVNDPKVYNDDIKKIDDLIVREDVLNIGIIGPYGSGKSSLMKTYEKQSKYSILKISLAKYNEEIWEEQKGNSEDKESKIVREEIEIRNNELEKSILQQMFYGTINKKTKNSSVRRIRETKKIAYLILLPIIILMLSIYCFNEYLNNRNYKLFEFIYGLQDIVSALVLVSLATFAIFIFLDIINGNILRKLNFKGLELSIGSNNELSPVDKFMAEIVYFFSKTKYTIVIFEDLDRFSYIQDLLRKIKEINKIVNAEYYETRKRKDKKIFIYAVGDDAIEDSNNKVKFFDALISLKNILDFETFKSKIGEISENENDFTIDCKNDLLGYVTDMRLLNAIHNDYLNFWEENLKPDKALAISFYKNIMHQDYHKLHVGKSLVNELFKERSKLVEEISKSINDNISKLEQELKLYEDRVAQNKNELIILIAEEYRKQHNWLSVIFPDKLSIESEKTEIKFCKAVGYNYQSLTIQTNTIPNFEKWKNRIKRIDNDNFIKETKDEIQTERIKLVNYNNKDYSELIKIGPNEFKTILDEKNKLFNYESSQIDFLNTMLIKGYISEDYQKYIYKESESYLSKEDNDFVNNIKNRVKGDINYQIQNIAETVHRLSDEDFKSSNSLNYSLLSFVFSSANEINKAENIVNLLNNDNISTLKILENYDIYSTYSKTFIELIYPRIDKIIYKISEIKDDFNKQKLYISLYPFLRRELSDQEKQIMRINLNEIDKIDELFGDLTIKQFEKITKELDLEFMKVDNNSSDKINFIYTNNMYKINGFNIKEVLNKILGSTTYQQEKEFSILNKVKNNDIPIYKYIKDNINVYVENWLTYEKNNEDNDAMIHLLNLIGDETLIDKVIEKNEAVILLIKDIDNKDVYKKLLINNKIGSTIDNLFELYKHKYSNEELVSIVNNNQGEIGLVNEELKEETEYNKFILYLLNNRIVTPTIIKKIERENFLREFYYNIENDDYMAQYVNDFEFDSGDFNHFIKKGMKKTYLELVARQYENYVISMDELKDCEWSIEILKIVNKRNKLEQNNKFIDSRVSYFNELYTFDDNEINNNLKDYFHISKSDFKYLNWYIENQKDASVLSSQINQNYLSNEQIIQLLSKMNEPYNLFNHSTNTTISQEQASSELTKILKKSKVINIRKVNNKNQSKVLLITN